MAARTQHTAAL